jgi:hypothetical protein
MGPTVWMTFLAGSRPPVVITAWPVGQPPNWRHWAMISGPPAAWMAPSTPPPPARRLLAALTMASTSCRVMSPCSSTSLVLPISFSSISALARPVGAAQRRGARK